MGQSGVECLESTSTRRSTEQSCRLALNHLTSQGGVSTNAEGEQRGRVQQYVPLVNITMVSDRMEHATSTHLLVDDIIPSLLQGK